MVLILQVESWILHQINIIGINLPGGAMDLTSGNIICINPPGGAMDLTSDKYNWY